MGKSQATFAGSLLLSAQAVCQGVYIQVGGVDDGRFGEVLWRRVLLADAAVEDAYLVVAPDLCGASYDGDVGECRGGLGVDVAGSHASGEHLHLLAGVFSY